jgi:hypothetical protein
MTRPRRPLPPSYPDSPAYRRAWARYSDNVTALDHWAGDILRQLDEEGRNPARVLFGPTRSRLLVASRAVRLSRDHPKKGQPTGF